MDEKQNTLVDVICDYCGTNDSVDLPLESELKNLECPRCFIRGCLVIDDFPIKRDRSLLFKGITDSIKFFFDPVSMRKRIMENFKIISFDDEVFKYNKVTCVYEECDDWLRKVISEGLHENDRSKYSDEIIAQIKVHTSLREYPTPNPLHLPFSNGIFELDTGKFRDYNNNDFFFRHFAAEYNPLLPCDKVDAFFSSVIDSDKERQWIIDWGSLVFIPKIITAKMLMAVGYGNNGKSLVADVFRAGVGEKLHTSISLHDLKDFGLEPLYHYRPYLNTSGELSSKKDLEQDVMKKLISGEPITLNRKNKQFVTMKSTTKFLALTNEIPENLRDLSDGWCRRILPIYFEKQFKEDEDFREQVTSQKQVSGWVSNVVIPNLVELLKTKTIKDVASSDEVRSFFAENMNSISAFCEARLEYKFESRVSLEEVQQAYDEFCLNEKLKRSSNISLGKGVKRYFRIKQGLRWNDPSNVESYTIRDDSVQGKFVECYKNIAWRSR